MNPEIDTSKPHSARVYDYWLGGKNNYEVDAETGRRFEQMWPGVRELVAANRAFMHRATRHLAREAGIRQFLDIGTGIPTEPNLHQVAQAEAPDCRVVYADNDPIVLQYAQALLRSTPEGRTAYLHADVTAPEAILSSMEVRETLDLDRPVALSLVALLHFVADDETAYEIVARLMEPLPSGSYLVLSHGTADTAEPEKSERAADFYRSNVSDGQARSHETVLHFFDGLELIEPGLVPAPRWRPDGEGPQIPDHRALIHAGVARKP
ncbi:S-adenosyl methyltransferase [Streptomyces sp. Amel2xB2]|uniref:Methyltransferase n=1 Tax=Streptomyces nanshensis TaxID=518642 RepID=A0A1E7L8X7_9ACTN|nr:MULTISPECIES: SAM-dependent methyltransferase [Streptomyces]OEV12598.1 methyltransferase [Streptomyces nanshensis]RAJ62546.1 S-adenosyl methyltransferase [Streptomyces sp. Amel2xB2]